MVFFEVGGAGGGGAGAGAGGGRAEEEGVGGVLEGPDTVRDHAALKLFY